MLIKNLFPVISCWAGKKKALLSTLFYRKKPIKWTIKEYKKRFGYCLDLNNPKTFYEKMNYWKHFYFDDKQTLMADKLYVKEYLNELGYGNLCAKCLFYTKDIKQLKEWFQKNKDSYNKMVLKTNHSCGDVFLYDNGLIKKKYGRTIKRTNQMFKMLKIGLKYNHYYSCFERPYKDIKPYVFVEEFIDMASGATEYEFMCNYGEIKFTKIVTNRQNNNHSEVAVDSNFNIIVCEKGTINEKAIKKPKQFALISEFIRKTCFSFPFCRVDFIEKEDKLYFCEFTFIKSGGMNIYSPRELDLRLGEYFEL